jgi:nucleotide-binding universal stress UspA family protein
MSFKKILVAIDNSPLCPYVFEATLELAQSNQGLIKLLHCISPEGIAEPMLPSVSLDATMPSTLMVNDYETQHILMERQLEEGKALLKQYGEAASLHGVATESECLIGDAGHQLCEVAKVWAADLVIVGRRGRTGLAEAFLGSVSNYVVHHAPCSVLVVQEVGSESVTAYSDQTLRGGDRPL